MEDTFKQFDILSDNKPATVDTLYSDDLLLLETLFERYGLKTVSEYSEAAKISRQQIYNQINNHKLPNIKLGNQTFIITNL